MINTISIKIGFLVRNTMVIICAQFAETAKVTYKLNAGTTFMRSVSHNGWKTMQPVPTAI